MRRSTGTDRHIEFSPSSSLFSHETLIFQRSSHGALMCFALALGSSTLFFFLFFFGPVVNYFRQPITDLHARFGDCGGTGRTDGQVALFCRENKKARKIGERFFFFSADARLEGGWGGGGGERHAVYGICGEPRREV